MTKFNHKGTSHSQNHGRITNRRQKHALSRRGLLRGIATAGGVIGAEGLLGLTGLNSDWQSLTQLACAQELNGFDSTRDRYYIFCYFSGGWDILVGLDPRDPAVFSDERLRSTLIQPGYDRLDGVDRNVIYAQNGMMFGPHIGELVRHADRLAVVRGMSMETLTHEAGRRRFLTGRPPSGLQARGSSGTSWLSAHLGAEEPIPNLSVNVESFNVDQPSYASALRVSNTADLLRTLSPADPVLPSMVSRQISATLTDASSCDSARRSAFWQIAQESRLKANEMTEGGFANRFNFQRPEYAELRSLYGMTNTNDSAEVRGALAVQALCSGMSRCVSVQVANGLDTHFDNWESDQGRNQERGFTVVARMIDDLAAREYKGTGRSWLDHTTVVGFSEFSRTPLLNANGGRDHALTNACFLLGGGIRGGQAVGASSDLGMQPTAVNLANGQSLVNPAAGDVILPEHVLQTLFHEVGIPESRADLRVSPISALI
jgi:uncharacterized protein (DUF1501 family)